MSHNSGIPRDRRAFNCSHCGGQILIPRNLAPTSGPCPHCSKLISSPAPRNDTKVPDKRPANPPTKLTSKAEPEVAAKTEKPPFTLSEEKTPLKLESSLATPEQAQKKTAAERKPSPSKPVVARNPREVDRTPCPATEFEALLQDENRDHMRQLARAAIMVALLIAAAATYYYIQINREQPENLVQTTLEQSQKHQMTKEFIQGGWKKDARSVLRSFLSASTDVGKARYVLGGKDAVLRIQEFYQGNIINDLDTPPEEFVAKSLSTEDQAHGIFCMAYEPMTEDRAIPIPSSVEISADRDDRHLLHPIESASARTQVYAFFMHTPAGLKIDWDIFVQTKFRRLMRFASSPAVGKRMTFRVLISQDGQVADSTTPPSLRYQIADPANLMDVIWATCDADSATAKALSSSGIDGARPVSLPATIELAWVGEKKNPDLVISRFVCWKFLDLDGK